MPLSKTINLNLVAAVANGIAQSQSGTAATPLTLNGSLVVSGVAVFDKPRQVIITSVGNDSGKTFTITGTDRYGRNQIEVLAGANAGVATTIRNFSSISSIVPSANTAAAITSGTNTTGSSDAWILDSWANPNTVKYSTTILGSANYLVEGAIDDFGPQWDLNANLPNWQTVVDGSGGLPLNGIVNGPYTMLRLTVTAGTGTVTAKFLQPFIAGRF